MGNVDICVNYVIYICYRQGHSCRHNALKYLKSSFPNCDKRKWACYLCQWQVHRLGYGKKLFTHVYMRIYVDIYEALFNKT